MASAALAHLTALLQSRKLDGTVTRPVDQGRPCTGTGVAELDHILAGGWPRGQLSEIVGPSSSGRTSVLLATLAAVTGKGGVVALVDVADRLDPPSAAAAGVDLDRLLWVRGPGMALHSTVGDLAVQRGLRAFDLIGRAGGFAVVTFDVADVPARHLRALPSATWRRVAHVLEGRDTVGLLLGTTPMGRSAWGVSVTLRATGHWAGHSARSRRLAGLEVHPQLARSARRVGVAAGAGTEAPACFFASSEIR